MFDLPYEARCDLTVAAAIRNRFGEDAGVIHPSEGSRTAEYPAQQRNRQEEQWNLTSLPSVEGEEVAVRSDSSQSNATDINRGSCGASVGCDTTAANPIKLPVRSRRNAARDGPSARVAYSEESALTAALKRGCKADGTAIFYPYEGTTFNSCEEAREFYNLYSWEIGFGIRYGRSNKNRNGYTTRQDIVCSCEGFDRQSNAASVRTGCKAMIRLLRTSDHGWYVSRICDVHNHKLSEGYVEKKQWNSHNSIDHSMKHYIKKLRENNVSIGRVCSILNSSNSNPSQNLRKETIRALCAKLSRENMNDDIGKTLKVLDDMKSRDPHMSVRFKLDDGGTVRSMLWCTGKNKDDYKYFGDAITFDTTYRTNLYSLPFGLFVGVNNHFQSIIFGGVLLTNETSEDFEWAFSNFIELMGNVHPKTMLTDQCAAMAKAIRVVLPNTRHRWCRWHVLKSAKKKLGKVCSKSKKFKREFYDIITNETDKDKFEARWHLLVKNHKLSKSRYMKRLFKHKEKWAKPYFMGVFCAGMTSTQRSESANHMIKQYIQKAAPMHLFVSKFNEFLVDRTFQEGREQHASKMVSRKLRVGVPIEEHAESVYTRAMFEKFYDELFESGRYFIESVHEDGSYFVALSRRPIDEVEKKFHVSLDGDQSIKCSCGLYEHLGMLCRHSLKVLVHLNKHEIPSGNILKRWTKEAVDRNLTQMASILPDDSDEVRKKALLFQTLQIVNGADAIGEERFRAAMDILAGKNLVVEHEHQNSNVASLDGCEKTERPTACPEKTLKGGRPPSSGLQAWLKSARKSKNGGADSRDPLTKDWPAEENPPNKKIKLLRDLV